MLICYIYKRVYAYANLAPPSISSIYGSLCLIIPFLFVVVAARLVLLLLCSLPLVSLYSQFHSAVLKRLTVNQSEAEESSAQSSPSPPRADRLRAHGLHSKCSDSRNPFARFQSRDIVAPQCAVGARVRVIDPHSRRISVCEK